MRRQDDNVSEWMRKLTEPRDSPAAESRRLITLLALGSVAGAVILFVACAYLLGTPLILALFVALFFLCLDAIAIAIVWYSSQRR